MRGAVAIGARLAAVNIEDYSRVYTGVHLPGDVIIGSLIGAAIGRAVAR